MSNSFSETAHAVQWVPVSSCEVIWSDAQRYRTKERIVKKIMERFDPDAFGTILLAQVNGKGNYHIIDGWHRITALRRMGWTDQLVPAQVAQIENKAAAAKLFVERNTLTAPKALEEFRACLVAGYDEETQIANIAASLGFSIGPSVNDYEIAAVGALRNVYGRYGGAALYNTLQAIVATWRTDRDQIGRAHV